MRMLKSNGYGHIQTIMMSYQKVMKGQIFLANMSIGGKGGESPLKKLYLNVPFAKKDLAKKNGARWDKDKKKWYYTEDLDTEKKQHWYRRLDK